MPVIETKGAASSGGFGQFAQQVAANYIEDVFSTYLYTGNGSTQTITNGIDLSTKGGLLWIKGRSATSSHWLVDTARGSTKGLYTDGTVGQQTSTGGSDVSGFSSSGFSLGTNQQALVNTNGGTFASWTFRKQAKFFDVVTWTGNGTTNLVSHSLGAVPGFVIVKCTSNTGSWWVTARRSDGFYSSQGNLNSTAAFQNNGNFTAAQWGLTSTTINANILGPFTNDTNQSGATYVAYLFAHDAGGFGAAGTDNVISCGSYVGNGVTSNVGQGFQVTLGWEPQWVIIKRASGGVGDWWLGDNIRGLFGNGANSKTVQPNTSGAEQTYGVATPNATGFTIDQSDSGVNASGSTYIYIAIRRGPMRTPTSGTSVFGMQTYSDGSLGSAAPIVLGSSVGFPVDTAIAAIRTSGAANITKYVGDRLRGRPELKTPAVDAESNTDIVSWAWQAGVQVSTAGNWYYFDGSAGSRTFAAYFFRRAPGFFDVVCYTGTGANLTITHNLGAVPQMMWVKTRTGVFLWGVYDSFNGATKFMRLNGDQNSSAAANYFNNTSPTSSVFTVGTALSTASENYVAYLFGSVSGVSRFGNYTGTGSAQTINCGFTSGVRFVLIKRTDTNGDWYVWDTARGITAGDDPYLLLNSTAAETTGTNYISVQSSGFGLTATAPAALNANGGSYIFLAIA